MRLDGKRFLKGGDGLLPFSPPVLQASFDVAAQGSISEASDFISPNTLESLSDTARTTLGTNSDVMPTLTSRELLAALSQAIYEIHRDDLSTRDHDFLALRAGLQISGVRIISSDGTTGLTPIRLSNVRLPFSLRLIGCAIEAPLALNNCDLVTLDLSGSAMVGLDATFLKASGSVRLRRSYIIAPADFGGARIHGYFDAADAVMKPLGKCPPAQSFDSDRGMLNLSQATIDNEIRLDRATIWGGLAMRGLTTRRSIFLDEAIILSPLAVLEAMAVRLIKTTGRYPYGKHIHWTRRLGRLADVPSLPKPENYVEKRVGRAREAAAFGLDDLIDSRSPGWKKTALWGLLTDNVRARTSAIRADGCQVAGNFLGTALTCHGRLRLKYANISGTLRLEGSRLRSVEAIRRLFDDISNDFALGIKKESTADPTGDKLTEVAAFRVESYRKTVSETEFDRDTLAVRSDFFFLDIRESTIEGTVRIGGNDVISDVYRTRVDGVLGATRATVGGDFTLKKVDFSLSMRISGPPSNNATTHDDLVRTGKRFSVELRDAKIAGSLEFDGSTGLHGINAESTEIANDFALFTELKSANTSKGVEIVGVAKDCVGRVKLIGSQIGGDCRLIFDKGNGPGLQLQGATVGGVLNIAAVPIEGSVIHLDPAIFDEDARLSEDNWNDAEQAAAAKDAGLPTRWQEHIDRLNKLPAINLRNARAAVFAHMPAAWPKLGKLELAGFHYARTDDIGPLVPHPYKTERKRKWSWQILRASPLFLVAFALCVSRDIDGPWLTPLRQDTNASSHWLAILMVIAGIHGALPFLWPPYRAQSEPMAIPYLKLQRLERNRFRSGESIRSIFELLIPDLGRIWMEATCLGPQTWAKKREPRGNVAHSLETYVMAARALRESGRMLSGNLVERRRLQVRTGQLSWRLHFVTKASFTLVDWLTQYGFSYVKLAYTSATLVLIAAMIAVEAVAAGALVPDRTGEAYRMTMPSKPGEIVAIEDHNKKPCLRIDRSSQESQDKSKNRPRRSITECEPFPSISYGLDVVVPGIDLAEVGRWKFDEHNRVTRKPDAQKAPPPLFGVFRYQDVFVVLHLLGLGLFGLFLLGITSWVTTLLSRFDD